jgi:two-component system phosphate regulon response regulator PhoB
MPALILVVEDEPAIQSLIEVNLRRAGLEVLLAGDAETAHKMINEVLPSLVLLDWMLPGMSGVDFARRLRSDPRTRDLPLIMVTARAEERDKIEGLEIGADDYITKPFARWSPACAPCCAGTRRRSPMRRSRSPAYGLIRRRIGSVRRVKRWRLARPNSACSIF